MPSYFRITVRFLQPLAHGRTDAGEPEWPPSPLRLFQAITGAAAGRWNERTKLEFAVPALRWLERQPQPEIVAATGSPSENPYRLYVPDNVGDKVGKAWTGGREASIAEYRTEKDVCPTHLGDEAVHYLFPLPDNRTEFNTHYQTLQAAARSMTHLGWGIDMVAADADVISAEDAEKLPGHRWRVVPSGGVPLRVPRPGTLQNLIEKHAAFLDRLSAEGFRPVPPLHCFDVVRYHSPTVEASAPTRAFAVFELHRTIEDQEENAGTSRFRPFHHVRDVATVAGMVRCVTATVAEQLGWTPQEIATRIQGHGDGDGGQSTSDDRFLFLPLPSVTPHGLNGIRRVMLVAPAGFDLAPLRRRLNGQELIRLGQRRPVAMLASIPTSDLAVRRFVEASSTWSTVTPMVLPGFDDPRGLRRRLREKVTAEEQRQLLERLDRRTLDLIWSAFDQAGWTPDALEGAEVEYRSVGWFRGLDPARNYDLPPLRFPRFHLRVCFPRPTRGPLAVGAGRYRGLGLFHAHPG